MLHTKRPFPELPPREFHLANLDNELIVCRPSSARRCGIEDKHQQRLFAYRIDEQCDMTCM